MPAVRYLIRFDDICSTMNWRIWAEIESCLRAHGVKPILSIVPRNRDNKLIADIARRDFWERAREWQALGWSIGLHGYEHRMVTAKGGIVGINIKSEFAGVPFDAQLRQLEQAIEMFSAEGVRPEVWVAPWHSFDANTILALRKLGIGCISDGLGTRPWRDASGILWVPQQLWRFRRMTPGLWTVCTHHNFFSRDQLDGFLCDIAAFADRITSLDEVRRLPCGMQGEFNRVTGELIYRALRLRQLLFRKPANRQTEDNRFFE